jgi:hypothetical protein
MAEVNIETGVNWLWYVNTGTTASPTWTLITTQQDGNFEIDTNIADATYKGSGGWVTSIPTTQKWAASFTCIYDSSDLAVATIRDAALSKLKLGYKLVGETGENYIVSAWVKTGMDFKNNAPVTFKVDLIPYGAAVRSAS